MLIRDVEFAARQRYDLIIVGGGIYGAMLALEATARKLQPLLLESHDFGSQTSFNNFRLIHGGLRYLQSLDIKRLRESVLERRWFLSYFPELVTPIPCLMPLYGRGLRRCAVFRAVLPLNDWLSYGQNSGLRPDRCLPAGRVLNRKETLSYCPKLDAHKLEGAALWWDAAMPDCQCLLIEILHWSVANGATVLNYIHAEKLQLKHKQVAAVEAVDRCTQQRHRFDSPVVINASGPWLQQTAAHFDRDQAALFRPTIAWNILLDTPPPANGLLAIPCSQTYFMQPFKGRLLLGTGHACWQGRPDNVAPTPAQLQHMLAEVNQALPGLALDVQQIVRVFAGLLPGQLPSQDVHGTREQALAKRPIVIDHGNTGGVQNLFSVAGVKFTTARHVASRVLDQALGQRKRDHLQARPAPLLTAAWSCSGTDTIPVQHLRTIIEQESVIHLDDLVLRRSTLWEQPPSTPQARQWCDLFDWDAPRRQAELDRLARTLTPMLGCDSTSSSRISL